LCKAFDGGSSGSGGGDGGSGQSASGDSGTADTGSGDSVPCYNGSGQQIACRDIGPPSTTSVTAPDPDALPPGVQQALGQVGQTTSSVASPLFPVALYGGSAAVAVIGGTAFVAAGGYSGLYVTAGYVLAGAGAAVAGQGPPAGLGWRGVAGWVVGWLVGD